MKAKAKKAKAPAANGRKRKVASSADILPSSEAAAKDANSVDPKWAWHFRTLLSLRARLNEDRLGHVRDAAEPLLNHSMDMADSATDEFDHDMALSELSAEQDALYEVEEALRRIQNNTYGVCEMTGKRIPQSRLKAVPWTRFSVQSLRDLEQQGVTGRAHLGQLASVQASDEKLLALTPEEAEAAEAKAEDLKKLSSTTARRPSKRDEETAEEAVSEA